MQLAIQCIMAQTTQILKVVLRSIDHHHTIPHHHLPLQLCQLTRSNNRRHKLNHNRHNKPEAPEETSAILSAANNKSKPNSLLPQPNAQHHHHLSACQPEPRNNKQTRRPIIILSPLCVKNITTALIQVVEAIDATQTMTSENRVLVLFHHQAYSNILRTPTFTLYNSVLASVGQTMQLVWPAIYATGKTQIDDADGRVRTQDTAKYGRKTSCCID